MKPRLLDYSLKKSKYGYAKIWQKQQLLGKNEFIKIEKWIYFIETDLQ